MRTSAMFDAKNFRFSEIYVCPHRKEERGIEPVRTKEGGDHFLRFCADTLYG